MYRLRQPGNEDYFDFHPGEYLENEAQVIFGKNSAVEFDENYCYGSFDKIELFARLGLGVRMTSRGAVITDSTHKCGYILRLFSRNAEGDRILKARISLRKKAIDSLFQKLDERSRRTG